MDLLKNAAPFILVLLFFWLFLVRPQQRRQRALATMQSGVQVGTKVMLSSGIFGTVVSLTDTRAKVEVSPGAVIEVMRAAIAELDGADADDSPAVADAPDDEQR